MGAAHKVGTFVRYGVSGVCVIEDVREMSLPGMGISGEYYVLRPAGSDCSVIYVPAENEKMTAAMIPVLTAQEINSIIISTAQDALPWLNDRKERADQQREILKRCDRRELLQMISCIYLRKRELSGTGRRIAGSDENALRQAEKLINNELTFVLGIDESQVGEYIRSLLDEKN